MSLMPIREYLKARIREADADFREHTDAFTTDNINANALNKAFHVRAVGLTGQSVMNTSTMDSVPVEVKLFFRGGRDARASLDAASDLANSIRLNAMNPVKLKLEPVIRKLFCDGFQSQPLTGNDNSFSILMNFNVLAAFSLDQTL